MRVRVAMCWHVRFQGFGSALVGLLNLASPQDSEQSPRKMMTGRDEMKDMKRDATR